MHSLIAQYAQQGGEGEHRQSVASSTGNDADELTANDAASAGVSAAASQTTAQRSVRTHILDTVPLVEAQNSKSISSEDSCKGSKGTVDLTGNGEGALDEGHEQVIDLTGDSQREREGDASPSGTVRSDENCDLDDDFIDEYA